MLTPSQFKKYVQENPQLVNCKESESHPGLFVVKYKHKVFYDALWSPELEEMRGTVVDKDFNVVIRPFRKIYNYQENEATIPLDEEVIAVEKINGFMAGITYVRDHGVLVSTTGSLDSPFVALAKKHIQEKLTNWVLCQPEWTTYLFEVCDQKNDPHIIEEAQGLHLIGARDVVTGELRDQTALDDIQESIGVSGTIVRRPRWNATKFSQVLYWAKYSQNEGYVVYGKDTTLKLKTPYYLTAKFLARCRPDKLEHALVNRQRVDEEFYPLLDNIQQNKEKYDALDVQGRLTYIREFFYSGV